MANIPIIFFHTGYSEYMPHTIKQAKETNERVILLGDKSNQHLEVEHYLNGDLIDSDLACFLNIINISLLTGSYLKLHVSHGGL